MFGIRVFSIGLLTGLVGGIFVTHFHVLRTADGFSVVPRVNQPPLRSSYCDVRQWSTAMWANHPEVTAALAASGRGKLIGQSVVDDVIQQVRPANAVPSQLDGSVARRSAPIRTQLSPDDSPEASSVAGTANANSQWLDKKSPLRQQWESIVDDAISPIVDEEPDANLSVAPQAPETAPATDPLIDQLNNKFGNADSGTAPVQETRPQPSATQPPQGGEDMEAVAQDLLRQVIPRDSQLSRSAAPLRNLGQQFRTPPAPRPTYR